MEHLDRIVHQAGVMGGKSCVRGARVAVGLIIWQIGAGRSVENILRDYPHLADEDIRQALLYAAWRTEERG